MAWEERFSPIERIRDRESDDYWTERKRDRLLEQSDVEIKRPKEEHGDADDG